MRAARSRRLLEAASTRAIRRGLNAIGRALTAIGEGNHDEVRRIQAEVDRHVLSAQLLHARIDRMRPVRKGPPDG